MTVQFSSLVLYYPLSASPYQFGSRPPFDKLPLETRQLIRCLGMPSPVTPVWISDQMHRAESTLRSRLVPCDLIIALAKHETERRRRTIEEDSVPVLEEEDAERVNLVTSRILEREGHIEDFLAQFDALIWIEDINQLSSRPKFMSVQEYRDSHPSLQIALTHSRNAIEILYQWIPEVRDTLAPTATEEDIIRSLYDMAMKRCTEPDSADERCYTPWLSPSSSASTSFSSTASPRGRESFDHGGPRSAGGRPNSRRNSKFPSSPSSRRDVMAVQSNWRTRNPNRRGSSTSDDGRYSSVDSGYAE